MYLKMAIWKRGNVLHEKLKILCGFLQNRGGGICIQRATNQQQNIFTTCHFWGSLNIGRMLNVKLTPRYVYMCISIVCMCIYMQRVYGYRVVICWFSGNHKMHAWLIGALQIVFGKCIQFVLFPVPPFLFTRSPTQTRITANGTKWNAG